MFYFFTLCLVSFQGHDKCSLVSQHSHKLRQESLDLATLFLLSFDVVICALLADKLYYLPLTIKLALTTAAIIFW